MKYQAIFFDVGWTLARPCPSFAELYASICQRLGYPLSIAEARQALKEAWMSLVPKAFDPNRPYCDSDEKFRTSTRALSEEVFRLAGMPQLLINDGFKEFFQVFYDSSQWKVSPEVFESLQSLRKMGFTLVIISNAHTYMSQICQELQLSEHFDHVIVSSLEGIRKPDARIFEKALVLAHVRPDQALHVGDFYLEDICGPHSLGIQAVRIDRQQESFLAGLAYPSVDGFLEHPVIHHLMELFPLLD